MNCDKAQEAILEFGIVDADVSAHVAGCETCRNFLALQRSLDEQLTMAYAAPDPDAGLRARVRAGVLDEKRRRFWDLAPSFIAPGAGLVTSGLCALLVPDVARLALGVGVVLSAASYVGQLLFTWLTEELGEG